MFAHRGKRIDWRGRSRPDFEGVDVALVARPRTSTYECEEDWFTSDTPPMPGLATFLPTSCEEASARVDRRPTRCSSGHRGKDSPFRCVS